MMSGMNRLTATICAAMVTAGAWGWAASVASAQLSYSNATPIIINDRAPASPYPTEISISALPATMSDGFAVSGVRVTLNGFSHTFPSDMVVVLSSPSGRNIALMRGCGADTDAVGTTLAFDSASTTDVVPSVSGVYRPTSCTNAYTLNAPGPAGPYTTALTPLLTESWLGTWRLWVADKQNGDAGQISGGWSLEFRVTPLDRNSSTAFTYQGVLKDGPGPLVGPAQVVFQLFDAETGGSELASPFVARVTPDASTGAFTTMLDFGAALGSATPAQPRWLQATVNGTVLTPRQLITAAPKAMVAARALGLSAPAPGPVDALTVFSDGRLSAAGAVLAPSFVSSEFRTSAPEFGYASVSAAAFAPASSGTGYTRTGQAIFGSSGFTTTLFAPVSLPHNVFLNQVEFTIFDNQPGTPLSLELHRVNLVTGTDETISIPAGPYADTGPTVRTFTVIPQDALAATIDNSLYTYYLRSSWVTPAIATNHQLLGARLTYSYGRLAR